MQKYLTDKKKQIRKKIHLTRPPRMEGVVKNAKMNPIKKDRKNVLHPPSFTEPDYIITENGYEEHSEEDELGW